MRSLSLIQRPTTVDFFEDLWKEFDRSLASAPTKGASRQASFSPALDIEEKDGVYTVLIDLPGMKKEDIKVDLHESVLTVSGERVRVEAAHIPTAHSSSDSHAESTAGSSARSNGLASGKYSERRYGRFERSVTLPQAVDAEKVEAKFEDGVLRLTLPQVAAAKPHTIRIQ